MHQTSWCRAVCAKVPGAWSRINRCRRVHTVVCWLSAGKSESPSMQKRTLGYVAAWVFASVRTLTRRDIIVANAGHHFHPWTSAVVKHQVRPFIDACAWHASGQWRPAGHLSSSTPRPWTERVPHTFLREANPQIWERGVFPGRIGTASRKHECLPPWPYQLVQQAHMRTPTERRPVNSTLETLLGPKAFSAYNQGMCEAVGSHPFIRATQRLVQCGHSQLPSPSPSPPQSPCSPSQPRQVQHTPVGLLRVWLPSALLGSRESSVPRDCTHSVLHGAIYAFWNQALVHSVWRREQRRGSVPGGNGAPAPKGDRFETWEELQEMVASTWRPGGKEASLAWMHEGTWRGVCGPTTLLRSTKSGAKPGDSASGADTAAPYLPASKLCTDNRGHK